MNENKEEHKNERKQKEKEVLCWALTANVGNLRAVIQLAFRLKLETRDKNAQTLNRSYLG